MAEEADEPDTREKFVLWSKSDKHSREGTVLDIDTGMLRRGHVLVLRSPQAEITLALGNTAAALMDFARHGETRDDPATIRCSMPVTTPNRRSPAVISRRRAISACPTSSRRLRIQRC